MGRGAIASVFRRNRDAPCGAIRADISDEPGTSRVPHSGAPCVVRRHPSRREAVTDDGERSCMMRRSPSADTELRTLKYVLITPAKNEAAFIEQTIRSVIRQTALPVKWVIVSDGSTDGTDEIVKPYAAQYEWIQLLRMPDRTERDFAGKVGAFNAGYARVRDLNYDVIGNLDGDITVEPDYFAFLLEKFQVIPDLGVAGTPFVENGV